MKQQKKGNDIYGYRIREARIARGYSLEDLSSRIGVSRQSLSKYEKGDMRIPSENIMQIANILNFPISFFSKKKTNEKIEDTPIFFRSLRKTGARVKESLGQNIEFLDEIYSCFNEYINFPKFSVELDIKSKYKIGISDAFIEQVALSLRGLWGLGEAPINNIVDLLQRKGIVIARIELDTHNVDAFSIVNDNGTPFIILGTDKQSAVRSRMDCAHELGHILLHSHLSKAEVYKNHKVIEEEAKKFAGAFLLPAKAFSNDIYSINLDSFIFLKEKWKVSIAGMIVRAHNLNLITDDQYMYLFKRISYKEWRIKEPLDDVIKFEEPELLKEAINLLVNNGVLTHEKLINEIALSQEDIENLCYLESGFLGKRKDKSYLKLIK